MTQIIAHRGASKYAPENTMPAFEKAMEAGADGIETDVQLTRDGIPILIHDEKLHRTTNGKGFVQDYTFAELQKLDAGSWFSEDFSGTRLLSVEELLIWIKDKPLKLHLELKNNKIDYPELEIKTYNLLEKHELNERVVFSSFNPLSLERLKQIDRTIPAALLLSQKNKDYFLAARELEVSALHIKYRLLNDKLMKKAKENNIAIRVYTVNRPSQLRNCFRLKCDGVFTDVPDLAATDQK